MKIENRFHTLMLLGFLTVAAYLSADTLDTVIGRRLAAGSPSGLSRSPGTGTSAIGARRMGDYAQVLERGLFGDGTIPSAPSSAPQPLPYTLIGTVEGEAFAGAVLATGRDQAFYRINRKMPDGFAIIKVMRGKVTLRRPDGSTVDIETEDNAKIVPIRKSPAAQGVRRVSGSNFLVDQREVLASTENMNQILMQARALPYVEKGKVTGFQISEIVPGSIFSKIGLQNGDIIRQVNSQPLTDPGKFFQLYQGLREERNISIDLIRGGRRQTMNYEIR